MDFPGLIADMAAAWTEIIRNFRDAPEEDGTAGDGGNFSGSRV